MSDYEEESEECAICIDNGSDFIKAGFAGDDAPRAVFPTIIGRKKAICSISNGLGGSGMLYKDYYVGDEAEYRSLLTLKKPIQQRVIQNWDDMEKIWHHTFYNELRSDPEERALLITEAPLNPKKCREKLTQLMFETFNVPKYNVIDTCRPALYSAGRTTGVIVDSGYETTHIAPIYEGYMLPHAVQTVPFGGNDLTLHLLNKLKIQSEFAMIFGSSSEPSASEKKTVVDIKQKLSIISAKRYQENGNLSSEQKYELPDGQTITLKEEQYVCGEALFNPSLLGADNDGVHELIKYAINKCDVDIRKDFYNNIVLCGGNTMFNGIAQRLSNEMEPLAPFGMTVKIIAPPERKYSAWIGLSILASLSTFEQEWISKNEYDESGCSIIHRRCV